MLAVATLSNGQDEIFDRGYVPPIDQVRKQPDVQLMIQNNDGLLDVPPALRDKHAKRFLKLATLSKQDKLKAELMLLQNRTQRQVEKAETLEAEIKKQEQKEALKAKGLNDRQILLEEAKEEVFKTLQQQAQEFIDQELRKHRAQLEEELERRVQLAVSGQGSLSSHQVPTVEMQEEGLDASNDLGKDKSFIGKGSLRMGTRKHPIAFGKQAANLIGNQSDMSFENENSTNTTGLRY